MATSQLVVTRDLVQWSQGSFSSMVTSAVPIKAHGNVTIDPQMTLDKKAQFYKLKLV